MYLSVLGISAEDADSGEVGRGNQVNGLISLQRPRGSEAAAGKNPASHVGKIYSVLSTEVAERIYGEVSGLREVTVWLCSRIGAPVDQPAVVSVEVFLQTGTALEEVAKPIRGIIQEKLRQIPSLVKDLIAGRYPVC
jgi:S-adenosylmethionine synthetase